MSAPNEIRKLLGQVREAGEKFKTQIGDLDNQIAVLYKQRKALVTGTLSKSDYLCVLRIDIQNKASLFRSDLLNQLQGVAKIAYPSVKKAGREGLGISYLDGGRNWGPGLSSGAFHHYFEDAIISGVERILEGEEWPEDAMPLTEIKTALASVDSRIEALTTERDSLANDLVSLGITE